MTKSKLKLRNCFDLPPGDFQYPVSPIAFSTNSLVTEDLVSTLHDRDHKLNILDLYQMDINILLLFTAPVSVAKDERTFSKMKITKNFLRSTTSDGRLEDLIVLATEWDLTGKVVLDEVIKVWSRKKYRKRKIKFLSSTNLL